MAGTAFFPTAKPLAVHFNTLCISIDLTISFIVDFPASFAASLPASATTLETPALAKPLTICPTLMPDKTKDIAVEV